MSVIKEMGDLLQNEVAERHSFYQLNQFLLGGEPTVQAKLWQALRELKTRQQSLNSLRMEIEELKDSQELVSIQRERLKAEDLDNAVLPEFGTPVSNREKELLKREREIELRRIDRQVAAKQKQIEGLYARFRYICEECQFLVEAFKSLERQEKLRPWDDPAVQQEIWNARLQGEFRRRLVCGQPLDAELLKAIESLHDEAPVKGQMFALLERAMEHKELPAVEGLDTLPTASDMTLRLDAPAEQ